MLKLNADMGEDIDNHQGDADSEIMPYIDQANIACGGHAGNGISMHRTVKLAQAHNVSVGAHPSYPDVAGFGRRSMRIPPEELTPLLHAQIGALDGVASSMGVSIDYVKPHGALYNDMIKHPEVFRHVVDAIACYHGRLKLMMQASNEYKMHLQYARAKDIEIIFEAFADRAYQASGQLVPRNQLGAVHDIEAALEQTQMLLKHGEIKCIGGDVIQVQADTLCVHGDSPGAVEMTKEIRALIGHH